MDGKQSAHNIGWLLILVVVLAGAIGCTKSKATNERSANSAGVDNAGASHEKNAQPVKPDTPEGLETALLAGGCFWGMEDLLRKVPGVVDTEVGYTGGSSAEPSYGDVKTGTTGHAESVKVVFDPSKISYADLLEKWFFRMHDPTTDNRQGNDVGTQYRSAIFATTAAQKKTAREVIERMNKSGKWDDPIVTEVVDAGPFTPAEDYHQDYLQKNPGGYTCHFLRDWDDA